MFDMTRTMKSRSFMSASRLVVAVLGALLLRASFAPGTFASAALDGGRGAQPPVEHRLYLVHTHTGERLEVVFRRGEAYIPEAIATLDHFLRDHRTGEVRHFDPRIYDVLEELTNAAGRPDGEIDIVCGYRSSWSNEFLRARTAGVAKNSLHLRAEAIDLRMPGVETAKLRAVALSLHEGGVGYYPHSNFIHVDVGRVRQWCFNCGSVAHTGGE